MTKAQLARLLKGSAIVQDICLREGYLRLQFSNGAEVTFQANQDGKLSVGEVTT